MDVHLPEYELRLNRSLRLARVLPLIVVLMGVVGAGLQTLGVVVPGVLFGAVLSGIVAAHAAILLPDWTPRRATRAEPGPVEGLAQT